MKVLVTGGNGQLGKCLQSVVMSKPYSESYRFVDRTELDITNKDQVKEVIQGYDVVINCAAYTNVEKAEDDYSTAYAINVIGVENLMNACRESGSFLIHISTDFVFDGRQNHPYSECSSKNPLSNYGLTKSEGENILLDSGFGMIIRTSWLYSEYGNNFYRTMLQRIREGKITRVISDQIGTPTYARDLANFICDIIEHDEELESRGGSIYHFTNYGCCSWYDFAKTIEIFDQGYYNGGFIQPCTENEYPTKARRPRYSVLRKEYILEFGVEPRHWIEALSECMSLDLNRRVI